jgi:hypothetical protein
MRLLSLAIIELYEFLLVIEGVDQGGFDCLDIKHAGLIFVHTHVRRMIR